MSPLRRRVLPGSAAALTVAGLTVASIAGAAAATAGRTRYVTLAFMLANGGSCAPARNGGAHDASWTGAEQGGIAPGR